jgi:hypothetical protein
MTKPWNIQGELILNCNCDVFCPCVVSLGKAAPTQGYCHGWAGVEIREGFYESAPLNGLNVGILLDIPADSAMAAGRPRSTSMNAPARMLSSRSQTSFPAPRAGLQAC